MQLECNFATQIATIPLNSAEDIIVPANDRVIVKTELWVEIPTGVFGQIAGRSGLASNHGITIGGEHNYKH